jgi:hypothetical protein
LHKGDNFLRKSGPGMHQSNKLKINKWKFTGDQTCLA